MKKYNAFMSNDDFLKEFNRKSVLAGYPLNTFKKMYQGYTEQASSLAQLIFDAKLTAAFIEMIPEVHKALEKLKAEEVERHNQVQCLIYDFYKPDCWQENDPDVRIKIETFIQFLQNGINRVNEKIKSQ